MAHEIRIKAGAVEANAQLNDTKVAQAIWKALPLKAKANLWGEEIYFAIPVYAELEKGATVVEIGDLGYWPDGNAFCIFFGPTPVSEGKEIRPASAVTIFGKVLGDAKIFTKVKSGAEISISRQDK